ncbi:MAG: hypothetical protein WA775_14475 [Psychroserpens sp.]|uniref:hypothetical protein n=1 Tax=Psychroserpens sp. TaxID=2020870 RepID=UPI003C706AC0
MSNAPNAKNELDFITQYQNKGYDINFRVVDTKMIASGKDIKFTPEQIFIVAEHRFEGMSNPSDNSILYIIEAIGGYKGTLINSYGSAADLEIAEFVQAIPEKNISEHNNILDY